MFSSKRICSHVALRWPPRTSLHNASLARYPRFTVSMYMLFYLACRFAVWSCDTLRWLEALIRSFVTARFCRFLLENHRTDLRVGFFYNGFKTPRLAGESETIRFLNPDIPSQGRLSLTGDNTEMLVQWTTATDKPGYVLWGTDSDSLDKKVVSKTITYTRDDMCGGAAKYVRSRSS
jgi:Purple acid Phosphatase, N-terminal domain